MVNLAIRGHDTRGNEVIEILEMLGGENTSQFFGDDDESVYSIDGADIVIYELECVKSDVFIVFTLEEFLEKFPYKVGDKVKVLVKGYSGVFDIQNMEWYCVSKVVKYNILGYWLSAENLQPYKEENMKENNNDNWAKWDLPVGYEFQDKDGNVINTDTIKLVKKQPQYPKTYEECCKILKKPIDNFISKGAGYKAGLLSTFQKLLICRDAYWKIAGEQMGLEKPWEPKSTEMSHAIVCRDDGDFLLHRRTRAILNFPTEEMRNAFYGNFKDLIEECKDFL